MTTAKKPKTLREYSELYGIPLPTIVNCRRRKWPLNDPTALLERFLATKGNRVGNLARLEAIASGKVKLSAPVRKNPPPERRPPPSITLEGGVARELERLEAETARSFEEFQNEPSPALRVSLQKIYVANVNALQKLHKTATNAELEKQTLLSAADVEATWTRAIQEFRSALDQLARRISTHQLFRKLDPVAVEELVRTEVERTQLHLSTSSWIKERGER